MWMCKQRWLGVQAAERSVRSMGPRRKESKRRCLVWSGRFERLEGRQLLAADFDNDSYDDLAIGASGEDAGATNAGALVIAYGGVGGIGARNIHWDQVALGGTNDADDWFGTALTYGDYNGDRFDDLAVSAPGERVGGLANAGLVYVIYGSATGLDPATTMQFTQNAPRVPDVAGAGDVFGKSLATGDFDGNGYDDLAIGVPGETVSGFVGAGAVNILYGGPRGLGAAYQFWTQDSVGILDLAEAGDGFGHTLATGDFDNNGFDELAVSAVNENVGMIVDAGQVHILQGSALLLTAAGNQLFTQDSPGVPDTCETNDQFGLALASADFDNNGTDDLAIGVPLEDVGAFTDNGIVTLAYGNARGLGAVYQLWSQDSLGIAEVAESQDRFGWSLSAGDFDGDLTADLAIGVPNEDLTVVDDGAVQVFYGVAGIGLTAARNTIWFQDAAGIADMGEVNDLFGAALASGDYDGNGVDDLAIGIVGEDIGVNTDAGALELLYGRLGLGIDAARNQFFDEFALTGIIGSGNAFAGTLGRRR